MLYCESFSINLNDFMRKIVLFFVFILSVSCSKNNDPEYENLPNYLAIKETFGNNIDLDNLYNYANQSVPTYITKDNGTTNPINDKIATLGRVLFYDKKLSSNNTISCSSCHKQEHAFSDTETVSSGVNGTTLRHSMRLINTRFANEVKFFWDERAASLEQQTTMPIKDHGEMGFSGENGDLNFDDLITKLSEIEYYQELFSFAFGSSEITETKIQISLAQFIRSIQSFDSKYDIGRALAPNDVAPFPNFTIQENQGKQLFLTPAQFSPSGIRIGGGLGCNGCHNAPEFDIDPNSLNNGIVGSVNGIADYSNTRAPSLRDLLNFDGDLNSPLMHNGVIITLQNLLTHYNNLTSAAQFSSNLDPRFIINGNGQVLNITTQERENMIAFLKTLSGNDVYTLSLIHI